MTRKRLHGILAINSLLFTLLLAFALACKLSGNPVLQSLYEFIRDMSLILVTLAAAWLASVFQRRANFLKSLREEWREIVDTKSILVAYCEHPSPSMDQYIEARRRISQTIDYMRIVYRNVLESDRHIGFYPYESLHDMRRALDDIDPRKRRDVTIEERKVAKKYIRDRFLCMRENFLEEFDLQEPARPVLGRDQSRRKVDSPRPVVACTPPGPDGKLDYTAPATCPRPLDSDME
jgi:hypothetical protein